MREMIVHNRGENSVMYTPKTPENGQNNADKMYSEDSGPMGPGKKEKAKENMYVTHATKEKEKKETEKEKGRKICLLIWQFRPLEYC